MVKFIILLSLIVSPLKLHSQNRPFPQQETSYNIVKPSNYSQEELNAHIHYYYQEWKDQFVFRARSTDNGYYIRAPGTNTDESALTHSEAHGFGMLIFALMSSDDQGLGDPEAKYYFDGMYRVMRDHYSSSSPYLMSWQIVGSDSVEYFEPRYTTATDGDFDIAYALLLAHSQWGSDGEINYLEEAKKTISAIMEHDIDRTNNRILLGSWAPGSGNDLYRTATRSSDWMGGHLRAFFQVDSDPTWLTVASNIYTIARTVRHTESGFLPDFIVGFPPRPADPNFLERPEDGEYWENACRTPWRLVMDYGHYGTPESREVVGKLVDFIHEQTGGDPGKISHGYYLDGIPATDGDAGAMYVAPLISAATICTTYQHFINSGWTRLRTNFDGYYSASITLLNMLYISGNWWAPDYADSITLEEMSGNLVNEAQWNLRLDALGSTASLDSSGRHLDEPELEWHYSITSSDSWEGQYAWGALTTIPQIGLDSLSFLKITYKSSEPIRVVLEQNGLAQGGASHEHFIQPSEDLVTVYLNPIHFSQPEWVTQGTALNLSEVDSISFATVSDGISGSFTLREVTLLKREYRDVSSIKSGSVFKPVKRYRLSGGNQLSFQSPDYGTHNFRLFSISGRMIENFSLSTEGGTRYTLNLNIPNGIHFLRIDGPQSKEVSRISRTGNLVRVLSK
ncbi:chitosanase/endoglucanase [Chitinispirillum alkaliphilum]|nr:chitosanase/endoglucanase [Chitinispirillum alkaliphilum]